MNISRSIEHKFRELFPGEPLMVRSPGRVNLIGEHTDYNLGFVLPAAIEKAIYFAIAPRQDSHCRIISFDKQDVFEFDIHSLNKSAKMWPNYLMGVVDQMLKAGYSIKGFNCVFGGDIPIGAGLSSSAALEAGLAFSLNHLFNLGIDNIELVKMSQKAENEFVGVNCGIMDQYINIFGAQDQVLKIDCRSLDYEYLPFEFKDVAIVLFDTRVSHSLASSEYNQRRKECTQGVQLIQKDYPAVQSLRDVTLNMLHTSQGKLSDVIYRRCKFVVEENERLLKGCRALKIADLKSFGQLMYQAHDGLSKEYEVSCKELDFLVSFARKQPSIFGARMMGGGFGGCTINLVEFGEVEALAASAAEQYRTAFGIDLQTYVTTISAGTGIISAAEHANI